MWIRPLTRRTGACDSPCCSCSRPRCVRGLQLLTRRTGECDSLDSMDPTAQVKGHHSGASPIPAPAVAHSGPLLVDSDEFASAQVTVHRVNRQSLPLQTRLRLRLGIARVPKPLPPLRLGPRRPTPACRCLISLSPSPSAPSPRSSPGARRSLFSTFASDSHGRPPLQGPIAGLSSV